MKRLTTVIKRPDEPELDNPYCAALDGAEYQIIDVTNVGKPYPPVYCSCINPNVAGQISEAINRGDIKL